MITIHLPALLGYLLAGLTVLLLGVGAVNAQEAALSTGGEASGTGGTSSYSIGQVAYTTNTGPDGSIAQGVQQPFEISTIIGIDEENISLELSAYPNPTRHSLTLEIGNYNNQQLTYMLLDQQGKLLAGGEVMITSTIIPTEQLPAAIYFLRVNDRQQVVKTFRIVKN